MLTRGKTLLVEGPASVVLEEGRAEALGAPLPIGRAIIIRKGKALPLETDEGASVKVTLGSGKEPVVIDGSTIPESWRRAVETLRASGASRVVVLGDVDCGKSTFCTYLANRLVGSISPVAVVDGDMGQSDIGPPAAVSLGLITGPVFDLFTVRPVAVAFVGNTSPSGVSERVIEGLVNLVMNAVDRGAAFIVVNTDGWVSDAEAVDYKIRLIRAVAPDVIVGIRRGGELDQILTATEKIGRSVIRVEVPRVVCPRTREVRRELREQGYRRFLQSASVRAIPLSWIKLEGTFLKEADVDATTREEVSKLLGSPLVRCVRVDRGFRVVLPRGLKIDKVLISEASRVLGAPLKAISEGEERGMLVALLGKDGKFEGVGCLLCVDFRSGVLKVITPIIGVPSAVHFSRIRLDESWREVEYTDAFEL
jgi:polynucleotide 5'-hydroxyl-kinase GRC3/NOL9